MFARVQVLCCHATRRSLCNSCLLSRRTSAYCLPSVAGRVRDPVACLSAVANIGNSLDPTRLNRYLASIKAADLEPTLNDVERVKPECFSQPDSSRYAAEYTNLLETLCRSFSKDQLRRFAELYKLDPIWTRSSRRKTEYAESIIEKAWGWPSLKEIERKKRDTTEVLVKLFNVTPSQLFLILGRDGADLLQLSTQYNVHISLTSSPLALRVEGLRGSLKGLTEYISSLKKSIIDEIFELPTGRPVRPDLLQRISRLAGAYVENHGHRGKIRICAKHLGDITAAKRLALRASMEVEAQSRTVCYDPPSRIMDSPVEISKPYMYSLYPFVAPSSFPWTMHSGGTFRLRRVADWLGVESYEDIASTGGLAGNAHRLLNFDQSREELSQIVCQTVPKCTSYRRRIITALLGHVLVTSGDGSQRTIFPPLRGMLSLSDILDWAKTSSTPSTFVPSVPPAMRTIPAGKERTLHRLIYSTLPQIDGQVSEFPQQVLKFEIKLSMQDSGIKSSFKDIPSSDESNSSTNFSSSQDSTSQPRNLPNDLNNGWGSCCQVGREAYINLMLPSRPMDVQFCIFDFVSLAQQPRVLLEYEEKLHSFLANKALLPEPHPPSALNYQGKTYYLRDNLSLRQSSNPNLLSSSSSDVNVVNSTEIRSETIVDLLSTQKMGLCQVKFEGITEGPSWKQFLAACDQLSVAPLQSGSKDKLQAVCL